MNLDSLQAAVSQSAWTLALDEALAIWRATRHPDLARLVDDLSRRAAEAFDGPRSRTSEAFHQAWLDLAHADSSALATGWLASTLGKKVPGFAEERNGPLLERAALLHARPPDPRIAAGALAVVAAGKFTSWPLSEALVLYRPLVEIVRAHGDGSLADTVASTAAAPRAARAVARTAITQLLTPLVEALGETSHERDPHLDALLRRLLPQEPSRSEHLGALLEQVHTHPGDEGIRSVLADAWMEDGSPRGELVALERAGVPPSDKRVKRLLRAHLAAWVGDDVSSILANPVFRSGLLHQATLRPTSSASKDTWERVLTDARLSTLRRFAIGRGSHTGYRKLVASDTLRDLRHLEVRTDALRQILQDGPLRPFERFDFRYLPEPGDLGALVQRFPALHQLAVPIEADPVGVCALLEETGLASRLQVLVFDDVPRYEGVRIESWTHPEERDPVLGRFELLCERLPRLARLELHRREYHVPMSLVMDRTDEGWTLLIRARSWERTPRAFLDGPHPLMLDPDPPTALPRHFGYRSPKPAAFLTLPDAVTAVRMEPAIELPWRERLEAAWGVPVG